MFEAYLAHLQTLNQGNAQRIPQSDHQQLCGLLRGIAATEGFSTPFNLAVESGWFFNPGINPDVALKNLFGEILIGDAKDANNERASHTASWDRIAGYQSAFSRMLHDGRARSGRFFIATNNYEAAQEWAWKLNLNAGALRIEHIGYGKPNYTCCPTGLGTWLVR